MSKKYTQVKVMVTFEQTFDVPEDIQHDEFLVNEFADECIGTDEMLQNCTDSGTIGYTVEEDGRETYESQI